MLSSRVTPAAFPDAVCLVGVFKPCRPSNELALVFKKERKYIKVRMYDGIHIGT